MKKNAPLLYANNYKTYHAQIRRQIHGLKKLRKQTMMVSAKEDPNLQVSFKYGASVER